MHSGTRSAMLPSLTKWRQQRRHEAGGPMRRPPPYCRLGYEPLIVGKNSLNESALYESALYESALYESAHTARTIEIDSL